MVTALLEKEGHVDQTPGHRLGYLNNPVTINGQNPALVGFTSRHDLQDAR